MLQDFTADLRFAARTLNKNRSFAAIAIATLALGIGANTAIFSVVDGIILRPLAYRDPGRLVAVHEIVPKFANLAPRIPVNAMHFREWRKNWHSAKELAILENLSLNLSGTGEPEKLNGARVSPSLFPMLGIHAALGRTFSEEEDRPGRDRVVVLSDGLWKRRFGADPNIVGRKIVLDGNPFEVVGVLPENFRFPKINQLYAMTLSGERPEIWKPMALRDDELDSMGDFNYACIARLRPGVTMEQALSGLNVVQSHIAKQLPEKLDLLAAIVPLEEQITGRSRLGLTMLLGAVSLVLLIACVNVANLLLARATGRRREIAIRSAIGASAARLMRQALAESLLLAGCGGALGVLFAGVALRALLLSAPVDLPRLDEVHLDARVLLFAVALTTLCEVASSATSGANRSSRCP
ncbi:MAG: ABC transporter permease [Bryobacteraceae bacterium]